jgi:hypothetical protein
MDYKDFEKNGKKTDPSEEMGKAGFWWKETNATFRAQSLQSTARALETEQSTRHNLNLLHARLYGTFDMSGFGAREYSRGSIVASSKIAFNVIEAGVDTLAAKISKHRPRPVFLTDGAKWSEQQKSRRLGRFVEGGFSYANLKAKNDLLFIDAAVFGTGGYKLVMDDNKKVNFERVFIDEVLIDEADARYGSPRQMFQGKLCHREKLMADYPNSADLIRDAKPPDGVEQSGQGDMVQVWEGWHLASGDKAGDGCHSIVLDGGSGAGSELLYEKWTLQRFPFVFYHFKPRLLGFWGQGVAELLTGIQIELNRLVNSVSKQLQRKGRGRIFMPLASKVPPAQITNGIADAVYYNGSVPPTVDNSNAVAQEEFMQIDRLYEKAFQIIGASELSVSSKKPSGLDAGVALREYQEIESERFAKQHQRWDNFHIELAEAFLDFVRVFGGKSYVTRYEHKRYMETIKADDVIREPGEYACQAWPSSSLPQTPAARRQAVKEMQADGWIDKATAQKLLDYPDLEAETNLGNAARDDVDALIDRILNTSLPMETPDKFTNLDMFVERGTANYLFARNHDADEKRLDMLARAIELAAAASIAAKQPVVDPNAVAPASAGAPPGAPPAPPGAPPVNINMPPTPTVPPLVSP